MIFCGVVCGECLSSASAFGKPLKSHRWANRLSVQNPTVIVVHQVLDWKLPIAVDLDRQFVGEP